MNREEQASKAANNARKKINDQKEILV